jgi:hypothetical protein
MIRRFVLVGCFAAAACGGASRSNPATESADASKDGVYEYTASIPGEQLGSTIRIRGTLVVLGDSLIVHPDSNCFVTEMRQLRRRTASYSVAGAGSLAFDRRNPTRSTWLG